MLEAHPELTSINRFIAFTYGKEGNTVEAAKYLDAALVGAPDDIALLTVAAESALKMTQYQKAIGYLDKVDFGSVADATPYTNMAITFINAKRQAEAIQFLDKLIVRFPETADYYFYRGYAKMGRQMPQEAKPDIEKYLQLAPDGQQAATAKEILASI